MSELGYNSGVDLGYGRGYEVGRIDGIEAGRAAYAAELREAGDVVIRREWLSRHIPEDLIDQYAQDTADGVPTNPEEASRV